MGRSKSKKQQAKVDKPGPDDFTYLAVFFPVGRNGAAMTKENDPADQAAAIRIGTWMHHAGLPIRKLFSRKTEEHVLVEVREEVPQDLIDSKLGAYRWGDMLHTILPKDVAAESTIMRAKVRSHDAVEKMGGMVYFSIPRIVPEGPGAQSRFKDPFPQPRRNSLTEPSTFSAIKYLPLPSQLVPPPQEDVKPKIADDEETKPGVKPSIKPEPNQDIKPVAVKEESKPFILGRGNNRVANGGSNINDPDAKPLSLKPEEGQRPPSLSANQAHVETRPDTKPKIEAKTEAGPDGSDMEIPVWDMMVDEAKPKVETKTEAENAPAVVSESNANNASRNAAEPGPLATQPIDPNRVVKDDPDGSDMEIPVWEMMVDEAKPKIETKTEAENVAVSKMNANHASANAGEPSSSAAQPTREAKAEPDGSDIEIPVWDMMVDEAKPKVEIKTEAEQGAVLHTHPNTTSGNVAGLSLPTAQSTNQIHGATEVKRIPRIKVEAGEGQGHAKPLSGARWESTSQPAGSKRPAEEEIERKPGVYDVKRERRED